MDEVRRERTTGLLTDRDRWLAQWLWRVRGAPIEQLQRRFQRGRTQTYRRLQVLIDYELVRRHRIFAGRPAVYAVPGRRIRPATVEHTLAVTDLVVARELAEADVLTEFEIKRWRGQLEQWGSSPRESTPAR